MNQAFHFASPLGHLFDVGLHFGVGFKSLVVGRLTLATVA